MFALRYEVLIDNEVMASDMTLNTAMLLIRALINEYYNEHQMVVSIREMERTLVKENE